MFSFWLSLAFLSTSLFFIPLKLFGGAASFIQTVKATAYITAAYQPIFALLDGVATKLAGKPLPAAITGLVTSIMFFRTLAYIHKMTKTQVFWIVNVSSIATAAIVYGLFLGAFGAVYGLLGANQMLPDSAYEPLTPVQVAKIIEPFVLAEWKKKPQTQNLKIKEIIFIINDGITYKGWADVTDGRDVERYNLEATVTSRKKAALTYKLSEMAK